MKLSYSRHLPNLALTANADRLNHLSLILSYTFRRLQRHSSEGITVNKLTTIRVTFDSMRTVVNLLRLTLAYMLSVHTYVDCVCELPKVTPQ